jgi:hypothetical protein
MKLRLSEQFTTIKLEGSLHIRAYIFRKDRKVSAIDVLPSPHHVSMEKELIDLETC